MNAQTLIIVFLLPPAVFGLAIAISQWLEYLDVERSRRRHPSANVHRCPNCGAAVIDSTMHLAYCGARDRA